MSHYSFFVCPSHAQTTRHYYLDAELTQAASESKANYIETVTNGDDGVRAHEVVQVSTGQIVQREFYHKEEPVGVWMYYEKNKPITLNFDFQLAYKSDTLIEQCTCGNPAIKDVNANDAEVGYVAPKPAYGSKGFVQEVGQKVRYPRMAKQHGIDGKVYVTYTYTKEGKMANIHVVRSVHPLLDKEAVRVIREMQFSGIATLKGSPMSFCATAPIRFQLN